MSKKIGSQFEELDNEKEEVEAPKNEQQSFLDLDKYKTKKEREKEKDEKARVTIFIDPTLAKRLERASKRYGKGFKSDFTADALEKALDLLEAKESSK
ncbi:hypothetical protein ACLHWY_27185 [Priestia aryabhattai]|uniref:hypothetical protein n=1 Tax=Priestia aryabhattai TaxID=412384 RepID=UPI0039837DCC